MTILSKASKFLSGFTFKFWLAVCVALLACLPLAYCKGRSDGKDLANAKVATAQVDALEDALVAIETADANETERTEDFDAAQDILKKEIEDAKASGGNALDAVFGGVPATD